MARAVSNHTADGDTRASEWRSGNDACSTLFMSSWDDAEHPNQIDL